MHSAAARPRPAARGTRPVTERGQSPPALRPARGKCPAGRSRPHRQTAGAGSLISPDGIVSEERLLSHKRTRTTAAMLVTGATAILPCSHSAGNSQPPSTSHAQCSAVSMDGQRRGCSGNQLHCPKISVDDHGHGPAKAQAQAQTRHLPADGPTSALVLRSVRGRQSRLGSSSANGTLWYRVATTIWAVAICRRIASSRLIPERPAFARLALVRSTRAPSSLAAFRLRSTSTAAWVTGVTG
jgi:hypothetical protein